jgi:hypothetical protein
MGRLIASFPPVIIGGGDVDAVSFVGDFAESSILRCSRLFVVSGVPVTFDESAAAPNSGPFPSFMSIPASKGTFPA